MRLLKPQSCFFTHNYAMQSHNSLVIWKEAYRTGCECMIGRKQGTAQGDGKCKDASPVLHEADLARLLTEALTTEIKTVFADETSLVSTQAALTAALAVLSGARKPDSIVGHFGGCSGECLVHP